jgi:C4-dicarboxylate-binding protein DctP
MQTGVVDGSENTPSNMFTQKHHEVQKYATLSNHGYIGYAVIVNKKFWDAIPDDVRPHLDRAMKEATAYANDSAQADNDDAMDQMRKSGRIQFIELTPEQRADWRKALDPVTAEMTPRVGRDTIEEFKKETGSAA